MPSALVGFSFIFLCFLLDSLFHLISGFEWLKEPVHLTHRFQARVVRERGPDLGSGRRAKVLTNRMMCECVSALAMFSGGGGGQRSRGVQEQNGPQSL